MDQKFKVLFHIPRHLTTPGMSIFYFYDFIKVIQDKLDLYVENPDNLTVISSIEQYDQIEKEKKYSFTILCFHHGGIIADIFKDQIENNSNIQWIHSLSRGVDLYINNLKLKQSDIALTNLQKGVFSSLLSEFIAFAVLFHTKNVQRFMQRKTLKKWETEPMELVSNKKMVILGYGDIGQGCAKTMKLGFGMKITGIKKNPLIFSEIDQKYCDEIVGLDQYENQIKDADFLVAILPNIVGVTEQMITIESTFSKMKKSSVFINIGRGSTVKEDDLITALKQKMIAGAVLDVFEKEPLSEKSELWDFDNVYISPHFACCDKDVYKRTISNFGDNLEAYAKGGKENLLTIVDKNKGY